MPSKSMTVHVLATPRATCALCHLGPPCSFASVSPGGGLAVRNLSSAGVKAPRFRVAYASENGEVSNDSDQDAPSSDSRSNPAVRCHRRTAGSVLRRAARSPREFLAEHRQAADGCFLCHLVLDHVPVLGQLAVLEAHDIHRDPVRGPASAAKPAGEE